MKGHQWARVLAYVSGAVNQELLLQRQSMQKTRPPVFKGRHFEPEIIMLCVRRHLRFSLSYQNFEELMAERNLAVDHVTICGAGCSATHQNWIAERRVRASQGFRSFESA